MKSIVAGIILMLFGLAWIGLCVAAWYYLHWDGIVTFIVSLPGVMSVMSALVKLEAIK